MNKYLENFEDQNDDNEKDLGNLNDEIEKDFEDLNDEIEEILFDEAYRLKDQTLLLYIFGKLSDRSILDQISDLKMTNCIFSERISLLKILIKDEQLTYETACKKLELRPVVVGLDIGTTKVVAIAGRKDDLGKLDIIGYGCFESKGVTHGIVDNEAECINSIKMAINDCLEKTRTLDLQNVYVGIAGQHIKSQQTKDSYDRADNDKDEINEEDLKYLIERQHRKHANFFSDGDKIIDIIPLEYFVDNINHVSNPLGLFGRRLGAHFHVITGDADAIKSIKHCSDASGLRTKDIVLQPLASAAAVATSEDLEMGVAVVDIGGGTTDMAVFKDGLLKYTSVIPYAGVNITNDIKNGFGISYEKAEKLKVHFGNALANDVDPNFFVKIDEDNGRSVEISVLDLARIIGARVEEIFKQVVFELNKINKDKGLHGGIILTGGGAELKNIIQLANEITGLPVRIGYPNKALANSYGKQLINPMYSTCIGLILRGCIDLECKINTDTNDKVIMKLFEEYKGKLIGMT